VSAHVVGHVIAAFAAAAHVATEHTHYDLLPLRPGQRRLLRLVAPRVERVIAVSATQRPLLTELGYRSERIAIVPTGVPRPAPTLGREDARARLGVRPDEFLACMVASLRPEKRVLDFVAAIEQAAEQDGRVRAVVVGGGLELPALIDRVQRTAAPVTVLGERDPVADVLVAADAACLSSRHEVLPLSLLEAAALGLPLVATRVGGVGAVVRDGITGYLVPPGDPAALARTLVRLAGAPGLRRQLGEAARQLYEQEFTVARMVDAYAAELTDAR
jgi:glycosyltransferase involved in cell wall biosynthesis